MRLSLCFDQFFSKGQGAVKFGCGGLSNTTVANKIFSAPIIYNNQHISTTLQKYITKLHYKNTLQNTF